MTCTGYFDMHIEGSCHCGNIQFEAEGEAADARICHCDDCQKISGAPFRTVLPVSEKNFTLRSGQPKIYIKRSESGNQRQQAFCAECGTHIYATSNDADDKNVTRILGLRVGTLKQKHSLIPTRQFWSRSALSWLSDLTNIPKIDKQ